MIGHYLLTLTEEQEDRVLTTPMRGFRSEAHKAGPCLVMAVHPTVGSVVAMMMSYRGGGDVIDDSNCVAKSYDSLCARFGEARANTAIRNRILSNRANRALRNAPLHNLVAVG